MEFQWPNLHKNYKNKVATIDTSIHRLSSNINKIPLHVEARHGTTQSAVSNQYDRPNKVQDLAYTKNAKSKYYTCVVHVFSTVPKFVKPRKSNWNVFTNPRFCISWVGVLSPERWGVCARWLVISVLPHNTLRLLVWGREAHLSSRNHSPEKEKS